MVARKYVSLNIEYPPLPRAFLKILKMANMSPTEPAMHLNKVILWQRFCHSGKRGPGNKTLKKRKEQTAFYNRFQSLAGPGNDTFLKSLNLSCKGCQNNLFNHSAQWNKSIGTWNSLQKQAISHRCTVVLKLNIKASINQSINQSINLLMSKRSMWLPRSSERKAHV